MTGAQSKPARSASLSSDGTALFALSAEDEIGRWLAGRRMGTTMKSIAALSLGGPAAAMDVTADRRHVAVAGPGREVTIWECADGEMTKLRTVSAHTLSPTAVRLSRRGRILLSVQRGGFYVWQMDWEYEY